MRALSSLLLATFLVSQLVHSFQIDPPSNIQVRTNATASYKRLKGEPQSWNFILRSADPRISDKRLIGVGLSDDYEYADSVAFACVRPGTYWIDVVSTDSSQLLSQVFARSNDIQAIEDSASRTEPPPSLPPPSSPPTTSTSLSSTSKVPDSDVPTPSPTSSTSDISTSSSPTSPVDDGQGDPQSQTVQRLVPSNPSTTTSSASTIPRYKFISHSATKTTLTTSQCSNRYIVTDTLRPSDDVIDYRSQLEYLGRLVRLLSTARNYRSDISTRSTPTSDTSSSGSNERRNDTLLIVGIVIGITLFLALLFGLLWYWNRRRRQGQSQGQVINTMVVTPYDRPASPASDATTAIRPLNAEATETAAGSSNDPEKAREVGYGYSDWDDQAEHRQLVYRPVSTSSSTASGLPSPSIYSMSTLPEYPTISGLPPVYIRPLPDPFARY
ncbi:hypothetical protein WG66_010035 [Moniliophthora roreri]|nr:hypothetical protein WG66_010035 [Moniliophthora roreri]